MEIQDIPKNGASSVDDSLITIPDISRMGIHLVRFFNSIPDISRMGSHLLIVIQDISRMRPHL